MKIIIVGAGIVGVALAEQLSIEGHDVAVIDRDRRTIRELEEKLDVLGIWGSGSSPSVLERAGIRSADMAIAVTDVDEVNLVVGMLAARYNVSHRVVRIRNRELVAVDAVLPPAELGIDRVINPDPAIVGALVRTTEIPGCNDVSNLAGGEVLMLGFDIAPDSPSAGKTPAELREAGDLDAFLILYVTRGDEVIVPRGNDRIEPGDKVHVLVSTDMVPFLIPIIHRQPRPTRRVIMAGASRIGVQLAHELGGKIDKAVLIEPDAERAEQVAGSLEHVSVLHGDPTDLDVLEEAAVDRCDLFCALSDNDQSNMLAALLAKRHGAHKTAVLVHQPEYVGVLASLGVEIVISPRLVTVGEILMHVRRGQVHSVTRLQESRAEILELEAPENCAAVSGPLKKLKFPKNALVGAIVRDGLMQIPSGDSCIEPGDRVVIFTLPSAIVAIEELFSQ